MATVYLGLGANLGDRLAQLREALAALPGVVVCSSVYETEPWGKLDQPRFLNLCCELTTALTPSDLHASTLQIERQLGRAAERERWGPRPIDIDILTYDDLVLSTPELTIPHPGIAERAFVLRPLAEIAPDLRVPGLPGTVSDLLERLPDAARTAWIVAPPPS